MVEEIGHPSPLPHIAKLNGDFKKNYGTLLGAFLYLRSISAARNRRWAWVSFLSVALSALLSGLVKHVLSWALVG